MNSFTREIIPLGYSFAGINVGIKDSSLDLGCILSDVPANASAVFTQNLFPGEPIKVGRKHIQDALIQSIVVNSKNANVYTGQQGYDSCLAICQAVQSSLGLVSEELVFPSSTGIIGLPLPTEKIVAGCQAITSHLKKSVDSAELFARAIMTTDQFPKWNAVKVGSSTLLGFAKGAGMIEPNMATMLTYFVTDADISTDDLNLMFRRVMDRSFNAITVDGDTSTSDTALILANGQAGEVNLASFEVALLNLAQHLAQQIVRDGEGCKRVIEVKVTKSGNLELSDLVAKSVLNSPLVKTAVFGADPNWGRILMAIGKLGGSLDRREKTGSGDKELEIIPEKIKIYLKPPKYSKSEDTQEDRILLNDLTRAQSNINERITELFSQDKVSIEIELNNGVYSKTYWGSDLSYDYIKLNAEYTT